MARSLKVRDAAKAEFGAHSESREIIAVTSPPVYILRAKCRSGMAQFRRPDRLSAKKGGMNVNNRRLIGAGPLGGPNYHSGWRMLATGIAVLLPLAVLSGTEQARADALPSNCTASGATVTCTYSSGSEGTFTVPTVVSSIHVVAVGAGGGSTLGGRGAPGAQVTADLSVKPGSTLYAEVDIGGGPGGANGAGGGGESDLRSCSIAAQNCPPLGTPFDPRLIVAGGGGGAGAAGGGGDG